MFSESEFNYGGQYTGGSDAIETDQDEVVSITEVSQSYKVSTRTIRYYEEIGLLQPARQINGRRVYGKKEQIRLKLIFRGKKYGFQLHEIREMIELFDRDRTGRRQLERTIEYGKEKMKEVTDRIEELSLIWSEMDVLITDFQTRLQELECDET